VCPLADLDEHLVDELLDQLQTELSPPPQHPYGAEAPSGPRVEGPPAELNSSSV
jgi:hypothetical protein